MSLQQVVDNLPQLDRIEVEARSHDFMAWVRGDRARWECAATPEAAIGKLVISHPELAAA